MFQDVMKIKLRELGLPESIAHDSKAPTRIGSERSMTSMVLTQSSKACKLTPKNSIVYEFWKC